MGLLCGGSARGGIGGGSAWASAAAGAAVARRYTPLHYAVYFGRADEIAVMAALLGAGADASIKDSGGYAVPRRTGRPPRAASRRCPAGGLG